MKKFLLISALAGPLAVSSIAQAQNPDDDAPKKTTKKTKKVKKTETKADGSATTTEKTNTTKTEKPDDTPANP
jgi:hypothetical protein